MRIRDWSSDVCSSDLEWAWREREFGKSGSEDGEPSVDTAHLPDVGAAAQQRRLAKWDEVLARRRVIDQATLSPAEQVNSAAYRPPAENIAAPQRVLDDAMPFSSCTTHRAQRHV